MPRPHRSSQTRRYARIQLALAFVVLLMADAVLFWSFTQPMSGYRPLMGVVVGSIIGSIGLLGALWRRRGWARYILLALLWVVFIVIAVPILSAMGRSDDFLRPHILALLVGAVLYLSVIVLLTFSPQIQRLANREV